ADPVEFKRDNLHGKCVGLVLEAGPERAHLLHRVDATLEPASPQKPGTGIEDDKTSRGEQGGKPVKGSSPASAQPVKPETPEEIAARKERKRLRKIERQKARETSAQPKPRRQPAELAASNQAAEPQPKRKGASLSRSPKEPVHVTCESALLEKREHRVTFTGSVVLTQGAGQMKGDSMLATMDDKDHVQKIEDRGNCDLTEQNQGEVAAPSMDFYFNADGKQLEHAEGTGGVYAKSLSGDPLREAWSDSAEVFFVNGDSGNNIDTIKGHGHARLHVNPPPPKSPKDNPAERLLTSNELSLKFFPDGKNLERADADKDATIVITPSRPERGADKKTIRAPQMTALFYPDVNAIKSFDATGGVHVEMDATIKDERSHQPRITTSQALSATFTADSQDIDKVIQEGDFKYEEGDRHGVADRATYYGQSQMLTLRGHRPMGWDTKDRLQADEIDYDNDKDETHARGDVRTTYYNPDSTNKSTPMQNSKSPIYVTADRADSRNDDSMAVYIGNAHGWQDDNFIKADRIELYQDEKRMVAVGHVESEMYKIERETSPGHKEIVPAFATAERMTYADAARLIHYEGHVKSRQDTDRVNGDSVDIYLQQDSNEVDHVIATGNVELIQPERHGWGDHLLYTSEDGKAVLTGKEARVIDEEKGSTMGSELTFYSRDDRIFVDNRYGTGRVRSTHRMERGKEKR
ncbi:MAG: LptA/OstA family protein, partial [Blastocatellia bacterium]